MRRTREELLMRLVEISVVGNSDHTGVVNCLEDLLAAEVAAVADSDPTKVSAAEAAWVQAYHDRPEPR